MTPHQRPRPGGARADGGSYAVELATGWGIFAVALAVLAVAFQVQQARGAVGTAAREAARSAAFATTPEQAADTARAQALDLLAAAGCADGGTADVDVTDFRPGGYVTVTAHCHLDPLLGPARTLTASSDEVVDRYRGGIQAAP